MRENRVPMRAGKMFLLVMALLIAGACVPTGASAAAPPQEIQQQLIHAVIQDQVVLIPALLRQGGDPNARVKPAQADAWALEHTGDDDPAPPLIVLACRFGSIQGPKAIQMLLEKGADANISDRNGVTPLMVASRLGMGSVDLLLAHGARVNARDRTGATPLMYAMNNSGLTTAARLLEKGANINAQNKAGETALMLAIRQAVHDPVRLYGDDQVKKASEAKARYRELIQFLIAQKADVNKKERMGNTALKLALAQQEQEIARLLRAGGAKD